MLKVTLKRSVIGSNERQCATVKALGLNKIGSSAIQPENDCVLGMINKISHLLEVERLQEAVEVEQ